MAPAIFCGLGLAWRQSELRRLKRVYDQGGTPAAIKEFEGERGAVAVKRKIDRLGYTTLQPMAGGIQLVDVPEAAFDLGLASRTVLDWMKQHPQAFRRGIRWVIPRAAVEAEKERRRTQFEGMPRVVPFGYMLLKEAKDVLGFKWDTFARPNHLPPERRKMQQNRILLAPLKSGGNYRVAYRACDVYEVQEFYRRNGGFTTVARRKTDEAA